MARSSTSFAWTRRFFCVCHVPVYVGIDFLAFLLFAFQGLEHTYREELRFLISGTTLLSVASSLLIALCLILHEFAHVLTARRHGNSAVAVYLNFFGAVASLEREMASPNEEFQVAAAGPILSILIALASMATHSWAGALLRSGVSPSRVEFSGVLYETSGICVVANWGIALFNLLPFFPMDGGRILRSTLWTITGRKRLATVLASWCSVIGIFFFAAVALRCFQRGAEDSGIRILAFVILMLAFTFGNFKKELLSGTK